MYTPILIKIGHVYGCIHHFNATYRIVILTLWKKSSIQVYKVAWVQGIQFYYCYNPFTLRVFFVFFSLQITNPSFTQVTDCQSKSKKLLCNIRDTFWPYHGNVNNDDCNPYLKSNSVLICYFLLLSNIHFWVIWILVTLFLLIFWKTFWLLVQIVFAPTLDIFSVFIVTLHRANACIVNRSFNAVKGSLLFEGAFLLLSFCYLKCIYNEAWPYSLG